ncbi:MAG TPA: AzlD domain-containing protein [Candidatus Sulfotelmatobacter sp.]|jgi:branched-subunit amino acid transport protein|nr:AzlD domain-containing protein [Candidatus Sulfotelmatobacter sp.]
MRSELILIAALSAATAVPRLLPAVLGQRFEPPKAFRRWLDAVPYAALGGLIFPGILNADPATPWTGLAAGAAALAAAALGAPAYGVAVASVFAAALVQGLR